MANTDLRCYGVPGGDVDTVPAAPEKTSAKDVKKPEDSEKTEPSFKDPDSAGKPSSTVQENKDK